MKQKFTIEEVHKAFNNHDEDFFKRNGCKFPKRSSKKGSYLKFRNFVKHGTTCAMCGIVGDHYELRCHEGIYSFQLFSSDEKMLTLDHIVPIALGGSVSSLENHQTLCSHCNHSVKNNDDFRNSRELARKEIQKFVKSLKVKEYNLIRWKAREIHKRYRLELCRKVRKENDPRLFSQKSLVS